jgi:hypothetical protein
MTMKPLPKGQRSAVRAARRRRSRTGGAASRFVGAGLLVAVAATVPAFGEAEAKRSGCVDWAPRVVEPLRPPPPSSRGRVVEVAGVRQEGGRAIHWAGARGWVPRALPDVNAWLLDHTQWKEMDRTRLAVKTLRKPGYEVFHEVHQDTRVFAFIRLQWVEEWAYALLEGSAQQPRRLLTTYQKTAGTDHIRRLCGSVDARAHRSGTDLYFYQEADADHYETEHIRQLHRRFFVALGGAEPTFAGSEAGR